MGIASPKVGRVAASQRVLGGWVRLGVVNETREGIEKGDNGVHDEMIEGKGTEGDETEEDEEEEEYLDEVLDDDSLLEAFEASTSNVRTVRKSPMVNSSRTRSSLDKPHGPSDSKSTASLSFTEKTDFILARDITWTQDIEAAKSRSFGLDAEISDAGMQAAILEEAAGASERVARAVENDSALQREKDMWDDFIISNTQIEREIDADPPPDISATSQAINTTEVQVTLIEHQPRRTPRTKAHHPSPPTIRQPPTSPPPLSHRPQQPMQPPPNKPAVPTSDDIFLSLLSTQDLNFSFEDLEDLGTKPRQAPSLPPRISPPTARQIMGSMQHNVRRVPPTASPRAIKRPRSPLSAISCESIAPSQHSGKQQQPQPQAPKQGRPIPLPTLRPLTSDIEQPRRPDESQAQTHRYADDRKLMPPPSRLRSAALTASHGLAATPARSSGWMDSALNHTRQHSPPRPLSEQHAISQPHAQPTPQRRLQVNLRARPSSQLQPRLDSAARSNPQSLPESMHSSARPHPRAHRTVHNPHVPAHHHTASAHHPHTASHRLLQTTSTFEFDLDLGCDADIESDMSADNDGGRATGLGMLIAIAPTDFDLSTQDHRELGCSTPSEVCMGAG